MPCTLCTLVHGMHGMHGGLGLPKKVITRPSLQSLMRPKTNKDCSCGQAK
jgi:hypothetical protein